VLVAAPLYLVLSAGLRRSAALSARLDSRRVALVGALAGAGLYASLTGLGAPIQRALVFLGVLGVAQALRRPPRASSAFAAAALCVCIADPAAPFAPGVQLSFAATAALVWSRAADPTPGAGERGSRERLRNGFLSVLRASASASAATAALVAFHFGLVSPAGWLSNAVAVPLTAGVLLPLALASGLLGGLDLEVDALLDLACALAEGLLSGCEWLAPRGPALASVEPAAIGLVLSAALALACVRARRTGVRMSLAMLATAAPALGSPPRIHPVPPRAVFLDVGQGDAAVVQGREATLLVDAGGAVHTRRIDFDAGRRVVLPALAALGVRHLDLLVASHADLDHRGGLVAVLRALPVARVWLPPGGRVDPEFAALREAAAANGSALAERAAGEPALRLGDLCVEALWPPRAAPALARNDASLVVRVSVGEHAVLFAGDLEVAGERGLVASGTPLGASVLKLAHHGSRSSSSLRLLQSVRPRFAVVSAPRAGRFGMPHAEVVGRLAATEIPWGWTGRDGALVVSLGSRPRVRAWGSPEIRAGGSLRAGSEAGPAVERRARPCGLER
jgi:competence protein ComEC